MPEVRTGYTAQTPQNLILDSGVLFKNYILAEDTPSAAILAGKCIGATRGGAKFTAKPEFRDIEVDGLKSKAKGLKVIDSWEVKMIGSALEISQENMKLMLGAASITGGVVRGSYDVDLTDYLDNITFISTPTPSGSYMIIQIFNAINIAGVDIQTQDKNEVVIPFEFEAHVDPIDLDKPPFLIEYKTVVAP